MRKMTQKEVEFTSEDKEKQNAQWEAESQPMALTNFMIDRPCTTLLSVYCILIILMMLSGALNMFAIDLTG